MFRLKAKADCGLPMRYQTEPERIPELSVDQEVRPGLAGEITLTCRHGWPIGRARQPPFEAAPMDGTG